MATFKWNQDRRTVSLPSSHPDADGDEGMGDYTEEPTLPERSRQQVQRPGYVGSASFQINSSSPPRSISDHSVTSHLSLGYIDRDAHFQAITPEDDTLRLASCVIRHILYFAPPQDRLQLPKIVEFRDAKIRTATKTREWKKSILVIDDGGLCLREQKPDGNFRLIDNHVAVLEAKTQFQSFDKDGRPTISDKALGQMVCEALSARIAYEENSRLRSSIVIHATQHYMCFLQIDMSDEYMDDLEQDEPEHRLNVTATHWFDLSEKSGRQGVLSNLMAIMSRAING
ncbi:hypothetical protein N7528_009047 [Penicillium herquei]|nr:hypothetical protein N7528_009047 [Penicillium herquei]